MTDEQRKGVMHSTLKIDDLIIMGCDANGGPCETIPGNDIAISIDFDSEEDIISVFDKISAGGTIVTKLDQMFWGARFGQCIDRFGKRWMLNWQNEKAKEELGTSSADAGAPESAFESKKPKVSEE
jgi:PhnB protein